MDQSQSGSLKSGEVTERVVTEYRDRIKVVTSEVERVRHEIVPTGTDCTLNHEWVRLHNASAGYPIPRPPAELMTPPQALQPIRLYPQFGQLRRLQGKRRATDRCSGGSSSSRRWEEMKCSARGDSQTDQQVNKLIALNPIGWFCLWAAGAIAENALHALRAFGRLPVRTGCCRCTSSSCVCATASQVLRTAWRRRKSSGVAEKKQIGGMLSVGT